MHDSLFSSSHHGIFDQLSAHYTCLRRSINWYRKVPFEFVSSIVLVNSNLIYKENCAANKVIILQFRESPIRSLRLGMLFERLKSDPRQKSTGQTKWKLADDKLEEKEASARDVRWRCVGCYEKIRKQESRGASAMAAKNKSFLFWLGQTLLSWVFQWKAFLYIIKWLRYSRETNMWRTHRWVLLR